MTEILKLTRQELLTALRARDGDICRHPDCGRGLNFDLIGTETPFEPTIDHWYPQVWCFENGWTYDQVWDLSNLKLMHKSCNAKKGSLIPNEDGTLPARKTKEFRFRRDKRADRAKVTECCNSGRMISWGDECVVCGSGPQPMPFPAAEQLHPSECPHSGPWSCWSCILEPDIREPAWIDVLDAENIEG